MNNKKLLAVALLTVGSANAMNVTSNNNQAQARDFVTSFAKKEKKGAKKPDYQNVGRLSTERTNIEEPPTLKKTNTTYRESTHLQRENMLRDPSSNQRDQMDPVHKSEPKHHEHSQAYNQAYKQLSKVLKLQTEHSQEEINEQKERADRYKKKVESYKKQSKQFQLTIDSNNAKFDEFEKKLAKEKDRQDGEKKQLEDKWAESLQQVERLKAQLEEVRQQQGRHVAQHRTLRGDIAGLDLEAPGSLQAFKKLQNEAQAREGKRNVKADSIKNFRKKFVESDPEGIKIEPQTVEKLREVKEGFDKKYPEDQNNFDTDSEGEQQFAKSLARLKNDSFVVPQNTQDLTAQAQALQSAKVDVKLLTEGEVARYKDYIKMIKESKAYTDLDDTGVVDVFLKDFTKKFKSPDNDEKSSIVRSDGLDSEGEESNPGNGAESSAHGRDEKDNDWKYWDKPYVGDKGKISAAELGSSKDSDWKYLNEEYVGDKGKRKILAPELGKNKGFYSDEDKYGEDKY